MNKTLVIFNPAARGERAARLREKLQTQCADAEVRLTGGPGDARAMAALAVEQGYKVVVAAGGDGTINEVVNGLAGSGVTLGLLPIGTMNVFAAELGIPSNRLSRSWDIIRAGRVRRIDLCHANAHYFVQLAGVGFDAQAVAGVDWQTKKNLGPLSYIISAAKVAARKPPVLRIETSGGTGGPRVREGSFVLVGNGRFYGGPLPIFRQAVIDDGLLEVIVVKNLGYLDFVRYFQHILLGSHLDLPDVEYFRSRRLTVTAEDGEDIPFEIDGELAGYAPVTFRVERKRLKVLAPLKEEAD